MNDIVKKANYFIENARYELSITQQRLILLIMGRIRADDEAFKEYNIPITEIAAETGMSQKNSYSQVENEAIALMKKVWTIEEITAEGKQDRTSLSWFASFHHLEGSGTVQISFAPRLKPYFLQLKNKFTTYSLACVLALRSTYSIRLFELLKMKMAFSTSAYFELEALKTLLQIDEKPYFRQYSNIKASVLLPAKKEISEKTDLKIIKIVEKKLHHKVIGLTFYFKAQPSAREQALESLEVSKASLLFLDDENVLLNNIK
jgi:plasmid replication initiation protein